ncbi:MAG: helix-turn-helix transcriptional regulator [Pyrinomonadaceae bacterium]
MAILDRLYAVTQDEDYGAWGDVYEELAALVGAGPGGMTIFRSRTGTFKSEDTDFSVVASNMDPSAIAEYRDYFQYVSPFKEKVSGLRAGEHFSRRTECDDEIFERSEIYNDFFKTHGIFEYEYHSLFSDSNLNGGINFSLPRSRPEFSMAERAVLNILLPHLRRAFELQQNFIKQFKTNLCMTDILDRLDNGVLIVDSTSRVLHMNSMAESMLIVGDGLQLRNDMLVTSRASESQLWRRLLNVIFSEDITVKGLAALDMMVSRPSGLRPLHLSLFHFSHEEFTSTGPNDLAIVFVHDPEQKETTCEESLISTYGLTPSEARLTSILTDGLSVSEASEVLKIQPNTVRTHLKSIYSKTDTNRQSELIRLVLKGPGRLLRSISEK